MTRGRLRRGGRPLGVIVAAVTIVAAGCDGGDSAGRDGGGGAGAARQRAERARLAASLRELPDQAFRITYDVEELGGTRRTEERVVRRPFHGRTTSTRDNSVITGALTNSDGYWIWAAGADPPGWQLLQAGRYRSAADERVVPALRWGVERGLVRQSGSRRILDRPCTEWRTRSAAGTEMKAPTRGTYADLCVDGTGLLLREFVHTGGKPVRTRTATSVTTDPPPSDADFAAQPTAAALPPNPAMPVVIELGADERARLPARLDPPPGFVHDGGTAKVVVVAGAAQQSSVTERYVRGPDLVELEFTAREEGEPFAGKRLAPGVVGELTVDLAGSSLRLAVQEYWFVTLRGTDPALLVDAARRIVETERADG